MKDWTMSYGADGNTQAAEFALANREEAEHQLGFSIKGCRVRVVRTIIYEGEAEAVMYQLARSQPLGKHPYAPIDMTIEEGELEVLG